MFTEVAIRALVVGNCIFYWRYFRIYWCGGALCPCISGIKNIIRDAVEYIDVEGLYAPVLVLLRILLEMLQKILMWRGFMPLY